MIEHPDVHQGQGVPQTSGNQFVGLAGLGDAGRVIVGQDHGRGIAAERQLDDLAGMDTGAVNRATENLVKSNDSVAIVQEQAAKDLMFAVPKPSPKEFPGGPRIGQRRAGQHLFGIVAPG